LGCPLADEDTDEDPSVESLHADFGQRNFDFLKDRPVSVANRRRGQNAVIRKDDQIAASCMRLAHASA